MAEERFTNRELKLMFDTIDDKLDGIREQTTKTNGRVTRLEEKSDKTDRQITTWKAYVTVIGGLVSLIGIGPLINLLQNL